MKDLVVLPLTTEEAKNLAIMLDRVPVTGIMEASCLVQIAHKLGACVEQAKMEAVNAETTDTAGTVPATGRVHDVGREGGKAQR